LDIDALLETPYVKEKEAGGKWVKEEKEEKAKEEKEAKERKRSRSRGRRSRSRDRRRSHRSESRERKRRKSGSRERKRSRSRDRRGSRDERRSRKRSGSRSRRRSRSRSKRSRSRGTERLETRAELQRKVENAAMGSNSEFHIRNVRSGSREPELTPEERDARTVFCMQLKHTVRARDVEDFFTAVGKVTDVKLIVCNKTRRFKGIAYVEFRQMESVPLALGLSGQKLCGAPVMVQPSQAEKSRAADPGPVAPKPVRRPERGPRELRIENIHHNITEEMLRGIFEPFGKIRNITLKIPGPGLPRSGSITFREGEDAKKAVEHLNGFELAGRAMKVTEELDQNEAAGPSLLNQRAGFDLGPTGRLSLMAKLAEGTGMKLPEQTRNALSVRGVNRDMPRPKFINTEPQPPREFMQEAKPLPPIATECFMLSNMFDPATEQDPNWDQEVRDDVVEECLKHGQVQHIYVDKASPQGNVYVKCMDVPTAVMAVNALHGRWFSGKVIACAYVPVVNYTNLFPNSANPAARVHLNRF